MPPKRGSKTSKSKKSSRSAVKKEDEGGLLPGHEDLLSLDRSPLDAPAFSGLAQALAPLMADHDQAFQQMLAENHNWLLKIKEETKDRIREEKGARKVPKTPKRGAFAGFAKTMEMFELDDDTANPDAASSSAAPTAHKLDIVSDRDGGGVVKREEDTEEQEEHAEHHEDGHQQDGNDSDIMGDPPVVALAQSAPANVNRSSLDQYQDPSADVAPTQPADVPMSPVAGPSGVDTRAMLATPVQPAPPVHDIATTVKQEPLSDPPVARTRKSTRIRKSTRKTPKAAVTVKEEVISPVAPQNTTPLAQPDDNPEDQSGTEQLEPDTPPRRRKTRAGKSTITRAERVAAASPARSTHRPVTRPAVTPSVTATGSRTPRARTPRVFHSAVSTPVKTERREQVQKVIEEQDRVRDAASRVRARTPGRAPAPSSRVHATRANAPGKSLTKIADAKMPNGAAKTEDARRRHDLAKQREEQAMQLKEQQNREKAERAKKDWEERNLKAKRKREEMEALEQRKRDQAREREERAKAVQAMNRTLKSPARTNPSSRVASPARNRLASPARNRVAHLPPTPSHQRAVKKDDGPATPISNNRKLLFPTATTPNPTTPGRVPAKTAKVMELSGQSAKETTYQSPGREVRRKPSRFVPKTEAEDDARDDAMDASDDGHAVKLEEEERQRRAAESERRRVEERKAEKLRQRRMEEERLREIERRRQEQEERLRKEERRRQEQEERQREEARRRQEKEEEERRIALDRERAAARQAEIRRQLEEEEREREMVRRREERALEEERAARQLEKEMEGTPRNKHLDNASFNDSVRSSADRSRPTSYDMTPDKVFKPSTKDNYNIDDLSSGDETDDNSAPRKQVPQWAEWSTLKRTGSKQYDPNMDVEAMYGFISLPSKEQFFGRVPESRRDRRGSSAHWSSPMSNPTKGKSRFLGY